MIEKKYGAVIAGGAGKLKREYSSNWMHSV